MTDQLTRPTTPGNDVTMSVQTEISSAHAETLWELYSTAFAPLRSRAVARQVLHRDEFLAEMADKRIWKYVLYDAEGAPVGLTTLTNDLSAVPWVSPEYFEVNFPEAYARGAVYYLGFTLAHPRWRHARLFVTMLAAVVERLVQAQAVCAYDVCLFNNDTFAFDEQIERTLHRLADVTVQKIDAQTYYGATFR